MSEDAGQRGIICCDGAAVPPAWRERGWRHEQLNHLGTNAPLTLRVDRPPFRVRDALQGRALDLFRTAAYIYGADQMLSRGGEADAFGSRWQRHLALAIPVEDPDFWSDQQVSARLSRMLNFLSDDLWEFSFCPASALEAQSFLVDPWEYDGAPDLVVLLSGGADSLCATLETMLQHARRPFLVSHYSNSIVQSRQAKLVEAIRQEAPAWRPPHLSALVNRARDEARETSQRSRAFLFASLGLVAAEGLRASEVLLSDNGVVSINLPFTHGQFGAQATRSTHPRFLSEFNALARVVFGDGAPRVRNSLWTRTRAEVLEILRATNTEALLSLTASCAHPRGRSREEPHCGVCSQCIDRRFGTLAAGLEEYDPPSGYATDIFRDSIPAGHARSLTLGYYNLAVRLDEADEHRLLEQHQRIWECIPYTEGTPDQGAQILLRLLKRHGSAVVRVMRDQVGRVSDLIARRRLPPYSLPALLRGTGVAEQGVARSQDAEFRLTGKVFTLTFDGKTVLVPARDGFLYIHELLAHPRQQISALDLHRRLGSRTVDPTTSGRMLIDAGEASSGGIRISTGVGAADEIDDLAVQAYRRQLQELDEQEREASERGDSAALERIEHDRGFLLAEIRRSRGLGGRHRARADPLKQPRQAVQKAIERAYREIGRDHPELKHFLKNHVTTGTYCAYEPDDSVVWRL